MDEFDSRRKRFTAAVANSLKRSDGDTTELKSVFNSLATGLPIADRRNYMDQAFRDGGLGVIALSDTMKQRVDRLLTLAINAYSDELVTTCLPAVLLTDIFEYLPIRVCEDMFSLIEDRLEVWKRDNIFNNIKNNLLRLCNDLLRRLSRSQDTVFCGRILLFLSKILPLSERSGLNIVGDFNLENKTLFENSGASNIDVKPEPLPEGGNEDETNTAKKSSVDRNLYQRFWSLQEFFNNPTLCYDKAQWKKFSVYTDEIIRCFYSFKLDDVSLCTDPEVDTLSAKQYFAKYLTSPKLLDLQLNDSKFRRNILVQFLITFHYLMATVKFKTEQQQLTDDQTMWVRVNTEKVYKLLEETPPNGEQFVKTVQHVLKREDYWNQWKNDGCSEFFSPQQGPATPTNSAPSEEEVRKSRKRRPRLGDELRAAIANKRFVMGNPGLTQLWNYKVDNMAACQGSERDFLPSMETFFQEAAEQLDPSNGIENQYKLIYDSSYGWRALRLLARRSPHFFTTSSQPITKLPLYLETMIKKLTKDKPIQPNASVADHNEDNNSHLDAMEKGEEEESEEEDEEEEILESSQPEQLHEHNQDKPEIPETAPEPKVDKKTLINLAALLKDQWKKLAPVLHFEPDEILYYESELKDNTARANQMLQVWLEQHPEEGTPQTLSNALHTVGLGNLATVLLDQEKTGSA